MTVTEARAPVQVYGIYLSPAVRKVLVVLDMKGVPYEIDPLMPFMGNQTFSKLSPLRRVPVMVDNGVVIRGSTIICEYLDERYPSPPILPKDPADRARARWLEEFADSRMQEVLIEDFVIQIMINPRVWGQPTDDAVVEHTKAHGIPHALDYLESELPQGAFLFDEVGVADIAIASVVRTAELYGFKIDPARWPVTAALVDRVLALESFVKLRSFEQTLSETPPPEHWDALARCGAPLVAKTLGTEQPRRGPMGQH